MNQDIETIVKNCRIFFGTNKTKSYEFRISQLLKLQEVLNQNKKELLNALYSDLHKTEMEGFFSEFAIVRGELKFAIKHLKKCNPCSLGRGNCCRKLCRCKALKLFSCNIGGYKKNNLRKLSAGIYIGNYRRAGRKLKTFGTAF